MHSLDERVKLVKEFEIVIKNARTRLFPDKLVDIGIREERIAEVSSKIGKAHPSAQERGHERRFRPPHRTPSR